MFNDIAKYFNISTDCLRNYLLRGNELNWCHYKASGRIAPRKLPKLKMLKDNKIIGIFSSPKELSQISKEKYGTELQASTISACASGCYKYNTYKGYSFQYDVDF